MDELVILARWGAFSFLTALAAIVLYKVMTGGIPLDGLLTGDRSNGTQYLSIGRGQLLLFTLLTAARYLKQVAANPSTSLPDVPPDMLAMLGGSQLIYLAGKTRALFFGPSVTNSDKGNDQ
jgi:hypothetical protein